MNVRKHKLSNGREWQTVTDGPSTVCVAIPIDEIEGMTPEQIGHAVRGLVNEARITRTQNWLYEYCDDFFPSNGNSSNPNLKYVNLCARLAHSRPTKWPSGPPPDFQLERLRELEELKPLDHDLQESYRQICEMLDGAYNYLRSRKKKLSEGQELALQILREMRHGCALCGLLDNRHTSQCPNAHPAAY
jgi:hypothetical protein